MASATSNPHLINFKLTPIEHNGSRRYKQVAIVLPLFLTGRDFFGEAAMIEHCVTRALFGTIVAWPIFGAYVRNSVVRHGKLAVLGWAPSTYTQPRADLINVYSPGSHPAGVPVLISQLYTNSLGEDFFPPVSGLTVGVGVPIVMMKITILARRLVLGFSFYEAVTDGESISRFFSLMNDLSWITTRNLESWIHRTPLQPVGSNEVNRDMFPFYDWGGRPTAQRTPRDQLVCQLVDFNKHEVLSFIGRVRQAIDTSADRTSVKDDDYVVAILWVAIMHARFSKCKVASQDRARLNILLPGEPHARRAENRDWTYFGSSTVPTVAELSVEQLIFAFDHPNSSFQDIAMCVYSIRGLAEAAGAVRRAMDLVDCNYVRHLMGLKESVHPQADWAAYERGIDRHTTGVTFEDWSGYVDDKLLAIPFTTGRALRVLPCADDMEEGKIILLPRPRPRRRDTEGNEAGWSAWLCLEKEVMDVVLGQLNVQDWIIGGDELDTNAMSGR
ncbi:mfs multidrug transporter [Trichoderma cornu-damae]|uniref:Mfs multidrug transporter n=1 Tax=Trichoderma cornu-damae TaxID=654480 RepID=A0A9P8QU48_9HYPO|nr:mfs multidrug transporter [Trichoderma cornu-damae]